MNNVNKFKSRTRQFKTNNNKLQAKDKKLIKMKRHFTNEIQILKKRSIEKNEIHK